MPYVLLKKTINNNLDDFNLVKINFTCHNSLKIRTGAIWLSKLSFIEAWIPQCNKYKLNKKKHICKDKVTYLEINFTRSICSDIL